MKITFLGGADEVGASSVLIETAGRRILVDAGIRPSPKAYWGLAGDLLPDLSQIDQAGGVDAILVTHAHTDHTGGLELVTARYPEAPVYATPVTIALTRVLHQDSRRIMQTRLEEEGELPLFDDVAVEKLMAAFVPVPFHTRLPVVEGLVATYYPAGHIAGAAMIGLESDEGRILISGDVSISPQRTVDGVKPPPFIPDVLILESTYGGRLHANRAVQERRLVETIGEVTAAGGKVLIPAFALGRAQELLLILGEFQRRGELPPIPVWADGMVRAVCQAYASFPEVLPLPMQERGAKFFDDHIRPVESNQQRNALVWQPEPAVIVSSSGMLAGGPSLSYARALAGKSQHAILLTGYQDEESPGRRLQELAERGHGTIWLGKDKVDVQCRLATYSLSAHADEGQLVSLAETLNPAQVLLVHGDAPARASIAQALGERGRNVFQPRAGQSFEVRFPRTRRAPQAGLGAGRRLDPRVLWQQFAGANGGFFQALELARAWWGPAGDRRVGELQAVLDRDEMYFVRDDRWPDMYRARTPAEVELTRQRRECLASQPNLEGHWLVLRGPENQPWLARCVATGGDHVWVERGHLDQPIADEEPQRVWPEDIIAVLGETPPEPGVLGRYAMLGSGGTATILEPNQALALAQQQFPPEARLRRCGYHLEDRTLVLTFDFPDTARERYAEAIAEIQQLSGWQVEITTEANQNALNALARESLPADWTISKGPAVYREQKRVAVTVRPPAGAREAEQSAAIEAAREHFRTVTGYDLSVTLASQLPGPPPAVSSLPMAPSEPWEINAAYAAIREALAGSTLYRTSLKGNEIVLSFISPQVGKRYREAIIDLARRIGWTLSINPQPNQGAILEQARSLLAQAGWTLLKGPSIYPAKGEVAVTLAAPPDSATQGQIEAAFQQATGYRLALTLPGQVFAEPQAEPEQPITIEVVEIPVARIRLSSYQQRLVLKPEKLDKTIQRARWLGQISPPIRVRRTSNGYLLVDGLYRLKAALALGLERTIAVVEEEPMAQ